MFISPGAMALAATGSTELTYKTSHAIAQELKYVGIQWAFGPVADVNSDPRNPVIGKAASNLLFRVVHRKFRCALIR